MLYANCFLGLTYGFVNKNVQEIKLFISHCSFITLDLKVGSITASITAMITAIIYFHIIIQPAVHICEFHIFITSSYFFLVT